MPQAFALIAEGVWGRAFRPTKPSPKPKANRTPKSAVLWAPTWAHSRSRTNRCLTAHHSSPTS